VTVDDFPEVLTLDDGGIFALRLDAVRAPALQPLDDVRDEVIARWQMQALTDRVAERAQAVADEIAAGREMEPDRLGASRRRSRHARSADAEADRRRGRQLHAGIGHRRRGARALFHRRHEARPDLAVPGRAQSAINREARFDPTPSPDLPATRSTACAR
jgi:hypothetical protein